MDLDLVWRIQLISNWWVTQFEIKLNVYWSKTFFIFTYLWFIANYVQTNLFYQKLKK